MMGVFSVAIPLQEGENIRSEQDVVDKLYAQRDSLVYHNLAQEAVDASKTTKVCRLLVVQLEKTEFTNTHSHPQKEEKIVGLLKFSTINSDELVGNVTFQSFSPKFRKVSVLRDYINACYRNDKENAKNHLDTLLKTIHPTDLPILVKILNENEEFKNDQKLLLDSVYAIEDAFIQRQKTTDILWTIGAVLTFSILHWARKAFFPESFGYFTKQTFSYDEVENIRSNMQKFWSSASFQNTSVGLSDPTYSKRTQKDHLEKLEDETAFHKKLFESKKEGFFNRYGQLRKHLIDHPETKTLEFIGTQQQIDRWLFFANAEKNGIYNMNLHNKIEAFKKIRGTAAMKPQIIVVDSDSKPLEVLHIDDSNDLDKEEYKHFLDHHHTPRHN